jgi:phosphoribosylglycinamide formyltransferase 1
MHGVKQAFDHGARVSGCTVHLVDAGVDTGPILAQRAVAILDDDTLDSLGARVHAAEHEIYPRVVSAFARGDVTMDDQARVHARGVDPR